VAGNKELGGIYINGGKFMNAKEKQNMIIKNIIKPLLKQQGYKNKGNNYRKEEEQFYKVITLQNFSWNSSDDVEFCFNFGILVKDIDLPFKLPENFGAQHCHIQLREGCFLPDFREKGQFRNRGYYNIKSDTYEIGFANVIEEDFRKYILVDFDNLKTLDDCFKRFGNITFWGEQIRRAIGKYQEVHMK
jgi:hypothetical protein